MANVELILGAGALGLSVIATLVAMLFSVEQVTVAVAKRRVRNRRSAAVGTHAKQQFKEKP